MNGQKLKNIKSRRVYYISGFDPRGARHYHRLYCDEASKEARRQGYKISIGRKKPLSGNNIGWEVNAYWSNEESVHIDYRFMVWDDIIRGYWEKDLWRLLYQCLIGNGRYFLSGVLGRISHSHRGMFFTVMFPIVFVFLWSILWLSGLFLWGCYYQSLTNQFVGLLGVSIFSWLVWSQGKKLGDNLGVFWLMRTILFVESWGSVGNPELEARIDQFVSCLLKDMSDCPVDEVVLVGHSVGSVIAAAVASRYLIKNKSEKSEITLITLGQCIPLLAFIPAAEMYRREVATLASDGRVKWFDISAKADPLCFFDENPALVCNSSVQDIGVPVMIHARFFKMFTPATYNELKRSKVRLHFQYVMAAELDTGYDYFRLTAGPVPVRIQLGARQDSIGEVKNDIYPFIPETTKK